MCDLCKSADDMYPDLGEGAMMDIAIDKTCISDDNKQGVRIAQIRKVTYMGPDGVMSRDETQCVYIGWNNLKAMTMLLIAAEIKHKKDKDEN